jgi:hypothetical protein
MALKPQARGERGRTENSTRLAAFFMFSKAESATEKEQEQFNGRGN